MNWLFGIVCSYFEHAFSFPVDQYEIEALHEQYRVLCNKEQGITREVYDQCLGPLGLEKSLLLERLFKVGRK